MSNPDNGAARNTMSEFERQCYDWGFEDAEERIVKLLEENDHYSVDWLIELIKGETNG